MLLLLQHLILFVSEYILLPATTKLGQGNIFTSVCLSMGGCLPQCMLGYPPPQEQTPLDQAHPLTRHTLQEQTPPRSRSPHPGADTPPREADCSIRLTSGRYASYWNAFLCIDNFTLFNLNCSKLRLKTVKTLRPVYTSCLRSRVRYHHHQIYTVPMQSFH